MPNKRLLALETATEGLSVALWDDGCVADYFALAPRRHAAEILPLISRLLQEADWKLDDLHAVAVGVGPGSFTGVRIGIAVAQGLALGAALPVIGISSLKALALAVHTETGANQVLSLFDARMAQVYAGGYEFSSGQATALIDDQVCDPDCLSLVGEQPWALAGPGLDAYQDQLKSHLKGRISHCLPERYPAAREVAILAAIAPPEAAVSAQDVVPSYVRNQVTSSPANQQGGAQTQN